MIKTNQHNLLDKNGVFSKMIVVEYGFQDEPIQTKRFLTEKVAFEFADEVFGCLRDIYVEYRQRHSIKDRMAAKG